MPAINDTIRFIFSEMDKTILDNFTKDELARIDAVARDLKTILDAAKKRNQDAIDRSYR
jgi:phosphoserine phosphatase